MSVKLSDVFTLQMGKTPSRANKAYWKDGNNCWVSIADLSQSGKYIALTKEKITDLAVAESGIKLVPTSTVVMSFKLSLGKTAITTTPIYTNEAIMAFIPIRQSQIHPDYIYHLFSAMDWTTGTNRAVMGATLNKATLGEIQISLPPLSEQRRIADELDKISGLIAKRKSQIGKLDLLVKARFVEMFGDETEFYRWECKAVGELADISVGVVIKPAQYYTNEKNGIRAFRSLNIGEMQIKDEDWVFFTNEGHEKNAKSRLQAGDVLVVRSGAPGTACVITKDYEGCNAIDVIIVRPNSLKVNSVYLCAFTNYPHGRKQIQEGIGGAAQQHFNVGRYKELTMPLPPLALQTQFADYVQKTEQTKAAMQKSLAGLETLYKARMQEYFE